MVPARKVLLYLLSPSQESSGQAGSRRRRAGRAVPGGGVVWP